MQVMVVSTAESVRTQAESLRLRGRQVIATGVIKDGTPQIALIDVTREVNNRQLDVKNLGLVDTFLRTHQAEILNQINTPQALAASGD